MTRYSFSADQQVDMIMRYKTGQTLTEIATDYSCTPQTVSRLIKDLDPDVIRPHGRWSCYTATQKAEMVSRYVAGETAKQISIDYGCSVPTVLRIIKEHDPDIIRDSGPNKLTEQQKQQIVSRYADGDGLRTLAKDYGCSVPNVSTILQNRGIPRRPLGLRPLADDVVDTIRELRLSGKSYRQIGETVGLHPGTVGDVCRERLGLTIADLDAGSELMQIVRLPGSCPRDESPSWRGGRTLKRGYALVALDIDDPLFCMTQTNGYVYEHRLVMARKLGRPLTRYETVHHRNSKDKTNNDPSNLQLRWGNHGKGAAMRCLDCGSDNLGFEDL